jgi:DNA-binding transcriptional LysR family regulator
MIFIQGMSMVHVRDLDLNLLLAFNALATERHVTRAAREVGVTQSAMSHSLARLRAHLGDPLFVRSPRGLLPTPRALALEGPIRNALEDLDRAFAPPEVFAPETLRRTFVVAATDYAEIVLLPPLLERLRGVAPHVILRLRATPTLPEGELESGAVDVVLSPARNLTPRLLAPRLFDEQFVCVVREGHPTVKARLTLERFVALDHLLISVQGTPGGPVDDALKREGLSRRVALYVPHFLSAAMLVAKSDLVLTVASRIAKLMAPMLGLRVFPTPVPVRPFAIHQIWHERHQKDPAHAWFRGLVAEVAKEV